MPDHPNNRTFSLDRVGSWCKRTPQRARTTGLASIEAKVEEILAERWSFAGDDDNISNTGYLIRTILGIVMEISSSHPDMLSIRFESPNSPLFAPHVPFFIGQGRIPPSWQAGTTNRTLVFQELMNAVLYNLDMADDVRSFWESFDDETAREVYGFVLPKAKSLLEQGDREAARELLYRYSNQRCEAALTYAGQLIEVVKEVSVIPANTDPFSVDELLK